VSTKKSLLSERIHRAELIQRCRLEECRGACCLYGAWVDRLEMEDIRANSHLITDWMCAGYQDPESWFDGRQESDRHALSGEVHHTTVLDDPNHYDGTACIFLREDYKCSLQVAADQSGLHPWRFKPFYCVLHPLDLDEDGRITLDETETLLKEPASCLRPSDRRRSLLEIFEPELRYLVGDLEF
jgi:hypothetical protein